MNGLAARWCKRSMLLVATVAWLAGEALPSAESPTAAPTRATDPVTWTPAMLGGQATKSAKDMFLSNAFVRLGVGFEGAWGLGTTGGDPADPNDDDLDLTFSPTGSSNGLALDLDGVVHVLDESAPEIARADDGSCVTAIWTVDGMLLRARYELVASGSGRADTAKVTYTVTNSVLKAEGGDRSVSLKLGLDIDIGNAYARLVTPLGSVAAETGFGQTGSGGAYALPVPDFWQGFQHDSLAQPGLVGQGTFAGGGSTSPDKVVIGQWPAVSAGSTFDYAPTGLSYGDTAVALWWLNRSVPPGASVSFVVLYGMGQVSRAGTGLAMTVSAPASLGSAGSAFEPNPFTVMVQVQNLGAAELLNVPVTIALPSGLSVAAGGSTTQIIAALGSEAYGLLTFRLAASADYAGQILAYSLAAGSGEPQTTVERTVELPALTAPDVVAYALRPGFQFVSLPLEPDTPDIQTVFTPVLGDLSFVKDSQGRLLKQLLGAWNNSIGEVACGEGYLVRMNAPGTLTVAGLSYDAQAPIPLDAGFRFVGYLPDTPMDALTACGTILDNLNFVKDSDGKLLKPLLGSWNNSIGDMAAGQGYLVRMNAADTLVYPALPAGGSPGKATLAEPKPVLSGYFGTVQGDPSQPTWLVFLKQATLNGVALEAGDEIGVLDGTKLVGVYTLTETLTPATWAAHSVTAFSMVLAGPGYTAGHTYSFKAYSAAAAVASTSCQVTVELGQGAYSGTTFPAGDGEASIVSLAFAAGDADPPALQSVHLASNNANPAWARAGDTVMLDFTATEDIQPPTVTLAGHRVTPINLSLASAVWRATYTMLPGDAEGSVLFRLEFADLAGNPGVAVTATTDGSAVTLDRTPPTVTDRVPPNAAHDVAHDADLVLTFSEAVLVGTGVVRIMNADGSLFESLAVGGPGSVTSEGQTGTITPAPLVAGHAYYVLIEATCFQDAAGNYFAGMTEPTAWTFTARPWVVRFLAGAHGALTGGAPEVAIPVSHGDPAPAVPPVTPEAGWVFTGWSPPLPATITADTGTTAQYGRITCTVTFQAGAHGTLAGGAPTLTATVNYGDPAPAAPPVTPEAGWAFTGWSPPLPATITADTGTTAQYHRITYTLTYLAGDHGSIDGPTPQAVEPGADGTPVTARAAYGYVFQQWSDGATANPRTETHVLAEQTYTAQFRAADQAPPSGAFLAVVAGAAQGMWDLSGTYTTSAAGYPLVLNLVHDTKGRLTGRAIYTVGEAAGGVTLPIKGSVKGSAGRVVVKIALQGADQDRGVSVKLALNLALNAATRQLSGPLTGSVTLAGTATPVADSVALSIPVPMDGTWTLLLHLAPAGQTVTGTALLTLSNGVDYAYVVRGRTAGSAVVLSLAVAPTDPLGSGITILATAVTLEGQWARLLSHSAKGYGQALAW